jgi:hemoglobin-like flavoprotein
MDAALLETSLALVDTPDDGLTFRFYDILFERHPAVRPMFSEDIGRQAKMLRSAIISVVDHLDDPTWLTETLGDLGARHASWGVVAPMYDAVTECMVAAMVAAWAEVGGASWTPQMTDAWVEALNAVAGLMLLGHPADEELAS